MDSIGFYIYLLALSVTFASCLGCSFEFQSEVLVVNCSRSSRSDFFIPDSSLFPNRKYSQVAADYQFSKLQSVTPFRFAKLRSLNLANNKITLIENEAFSKVALYDLDLSYNKLTSITAKQLIGLKELRTLSLYSNVISHVDPDAFQSMAALEELDLGHNFITGQLDPALFVPTKKLRILSLRENVLESVDPKTFQNLKSLEELSLAENSIAGLDSTTFKPLYDLKSLDLSHNKFAGLDKELLKNQLEIEYLDLSWNSLEYFGEKLGLSPSLKVIKIGHNNLKDVEISGKLKELKEIYVENNMLENIQFLESLTALEKVNASSNNIAAVEETTFQYLHTLDLSNNSFTNIPSLIAADKLPSLSHLHFHMNPIESLKFPPSQGGFNSLQLVTLNRMPHLKEVSRDSFDALRSSGSRRRRSPSDADYDYSEEEEEEETATTVNETQTTVEDEAEAETEGTEEVRKTAEGKTDAPKEVGSENNDGDKEGIQAVTNEATEKESQESSEENEEHEEEEETQKEVAGETTVAAITGADRQETSLNLETAELIAEDGDVPKMRTAKLRVEPSFPGGGRTAIDDCSVSGLTLDISHNENLAKIEDESFVDIDVCKLDLSYNALTSVPKKMAKWDELPSIDFQGNPWDCSCSLQWLLDTIVPKLYPHEETQHLLYELRCASPAALRGRRFVHFYNWTEEAFCVTHGKMLMLPPTDDDATGVTLQLGGSTGMFVGVGIAIGMVALLVGVAAWLHRSNTLKKRARNRRV